MEDFTVIETRKLREVRKGATRKHIINVTVRNEFGVQIIGDDIVIDQVVKQLRKLIDTIKVRDLTDIPHVERELVLIKVHTPTARARDEVLRITEIFRGKIVDVSQETYTIEVTGDEDKIRAIVELLMI